MPSAFRAYSLPEKLLQFPPVIIIDVRSETEFQKGHIPGAINLPVLNDSERAQVGTTYKQVSATEAVQLGLGLFAEKAEAYLEAITRAVGPSKQVLLYCWRGGMRSQSVAKWLSCAGFHGYWLAGGYKAYRKSVLAILSALGEHSLIVLHGRTGVGKSQLIGNLEQQGFPVLNFQRLAHHRGSIFGGMGQTKESPTQQNFENQLAEQYQKISSFPKILVEIENFIGPIALSQGLRTNIQKAPMIFLDRKFEERVSHLADLYVSRWSDRDEKLFTEGLSVLRRFFTCEEMSKIERNIYEKNFEPVIALFLQRRYDPAYDKSLARHRSQALASFDLSIRKEEIIEFLHNLFFT